MNIHIFDSSCVSPNLNIANYPFVSIYKMLPPRKEQLGYCEPFVPKNILGTHLLEAESHRSIEKNPTASSGIKPKLSGL
jgi:hypothetical protein